MRTYRLLSAGLAAVASVLSAAAQGTFLDLDFEQAKIIPDPRNTEFIAASNAVPGWTVYFGGSPQGMVVNNGINSGAPGVSIAYTPSAYLQQGNYSVVLQGSGLTGGPKGGIGQVGEIPTGTVSTLLRLSPGDAAWQLRSSLAFVFLPGETPQPRQ